MPYPAFATLLATCTLIFGCGAGSGEPRLTDAGLAALVADVRAGTAIPAMGAAIASTEGVQAVAVDGVRRLDGDDAVHRSDAFHIGSVAKTMTATLAAQLVASGKLSWDSRVASTLPQAVAEGRPEYRDITLGQLLAHEAGIQPLTSDEEIARLPALAGPVEQQRRELAAWLLTREPVVTPGEEYSYSNGGFVIAASMLETVSGQTWESLMRDRLMTPLAMENSGFGWPGAGNDAAGHFLWGHRLIDGELRPVNPDGDYQLPEVMAPAGDVYASLDDMARYTAAYLRAWRGESAVLDETTVRRMYTPRIKSGIGWGVQSLMGHDPVAVYSGSADTFLVMIAVIPEAGAAVVVAANAASPEAESATVTLLKRTIEMAVPPSPA